MNGREIIEAAKRAYEYRQILTLYTVAELNIETFTHEEIIVIDQFLEMKTADLFVRDMDLMSAIPEGVVIRRRIMEEQPE